jgi:hypothetical protein
MSLLRATVAGVKFCKQAGSRLTDEYVAGVLCMWPPHVERDDLRMRQNRQP